MVVDCLRLLTSTELFLCERDSSYLLINTHELAIKLHVFKSQQKPGKMLGSGHYPTDTGLVSFVLLRRRCSSANCKMK